MPDLNPAEKAPVALAAGFAPVAALFAGLAWDFLRRMRP